MDIFIRAMKNGEWNHCFNLDASFIVDSALVLSIINQKLSYTVEEISSYKKSYLDEWEEMSNEDYSAYINNPNQIIFLAFIENQVVGQITAKRNWNEYACIEDLHVDKPYRGQGVGRKLIEQAKQWARDSAMPGLMLETQNTNVRACKFYENCGFVIGGFDLYLYKGIDKQQDEIAMYWYLMLK
jgi:streptothricin acetyltransferase